MQHGGLDFNSFTRHERITQYLVRNATHLRHSRYTTHEATTFPGCFMLLNVPQSFHCSYYELSIRPMCMIPLTCLGGGGTYRQQHRHTAAGQQFVACQLFSNQWSASACQHYGQWAKTVCIGWTTAMRAGHATNCLQTPPLPAGWHAPLYKPSCRTFSQLGGKRPTSIWAGWHSPCTAVLQRQAINITHSPVPNSTVEQSQEVQHQHSSTKSCFNTCRQ